MATITWGDVIASGDASASIPCGLDDMTILEAALAYAARGWYLVPALPETKNPGSVVGRAWPTKSSREPSQIRRWFASTDYSIALHMGRSGAVAFDVDYPREVPPLLAREFASKMVPHQETRADEPGRGHYLFEAPTGLHIGNGLGRLPRGWGEVRGGNSVIIASPSCHSVGGRYAWVRTGALPPLPASILLQLPLGGSEAASSVTSSEAQAFIDRHTSSDLPALFDERCVVLTRKLKAGSRHDSFVSAVCWMMKDAAVGLYPAQHVIDALYPLFNAVKPPEEQTTNEFVGLVRWAVGQAESMTEDEMVLYRANNAPSLIPGMQEWLRSLGDA